MADGTRTCNRSLPASSLKYVLEPGEFMNFAALTLRPATVRDAPAFAEAVNESLPQLRQFMSWAFYPQTVASQRERIAAVHADYWRGHEFIFGIFAEPGEVLVGSIGLRPRTLNALGLEIGYWARSQFAGHGLTTLAAQCMIVYGFDYLGLTKLACGHDPANKASERVNEKCGFLVEGRLRNHETVPTQAMRDGGFLGSNVIVVRGLIPTDIPTLPWYDRIRARLQVYDWRDELLTPCAKSR